MELVCGLESSWLLASFPSALMQPIHVPIRALELLVHRERAKGEAKAEEEEEEGKKALLDFFFKSHVGITATMIRRAKTRF